VVFCTIIYLLRKQIVFFDKISRCNFCCNLCSLSIILYADNILLLAPTVSSLQQLLHICEIKPAWLDLSKKCEKYRHLYKLALAIIVSVVT